MAALLMSPSSLSLPKPLSLSSLPTNPILPRLSFPPRPTPSLTIRNGGGPRTFPGGVSKWQWKRMQAKKAKQLLKARLLRERQIYDMRKRAELRAAVADLERPWEPVAPAAPTLFSVSADDQVRALADRFQRPGGFDMWSPRDGPRVLPGGAPHHSLLPTSRFFPKGVVHGVKPYGSASDAPPYDDWVARGAGGVRRRRRTTDCTEGVRSNSSVEGNDEVEFDVIDCSDGVRSNSPEEGNYKARDVRRYMMRHGYRPHDSKWNSGDNRASRNVGDERVGNRAQNGDSKRGSSSRSLDNRRGGGRVQVSDSKRISGSSGTPMIDRRSE